MREGSVGVRAAGTVDGAVGAAAADGSKEATELGASGGKVGGSAIGRRPSRVAAVQQLASPGAPRCCWAVASLHVLLSRGKSAAWPGNVAETATWHSAIRLECTIGSTLDTIHNHYELFSSLLSYSLISYAALPRRAGRCL